MITRGYSLSQGGNVLFMEISESDPEALHFALIVHRKTAETPTPLSAGQLVALQQQLLAQVEQEENPIYLTGRMVSNMYPPETPPLPLITISKVTHYQFFVFRWLSFSWEANGAVNINKNGEAVKVGKAKGRTSF